MEGIELIDKTEQEDMAKVSNFEEIRKQKGMSVSEFYAIPRDPPSESKLPIFDAAHVRNALARFNQVQGVSVEEKAKAHRKILAAAKKFDIKVAEKQSAEEPETPESEPQPENEPEAESDENKDELSVGNDEERAKSHFKISDEEWNKLTPEEKKNYIDKLPKDSKEPTEKPMVSEKKEDTDMEELKKIEEEFKKKEELMQKEMSELKNKIQELENTGIKKAVEKLEETKAIIADKPSEPSPYIIQKDGSIYRWD